MVEFMFQIDDYRLQKRCSVLMFLCISLYNKRSRRESKRFDDSRDFMKKKRFDEIRMRLQVAESLVQCTED